MEGYGVIASGVCALSAETLLNFRGGDIEGIGQGASVVREGVAPHPYPALTGDTDAQMSDLDSPPCLF